jgi:hypothetical protein
MSHFPTNNEHFLYNTLITEHVMAQFQRLALYTMNRLNDLFSIYTVGIRFEAMQTNEEERKEVVCKF